MGKLNLEFIMWFVLICEFGYGKVGVGKVSWWFVILIYLVFGLKFYDIVLFWIRFGVERFGFGIMVDICFFNGFEWYFESKSL